jgi:hypothetical protein
MKPNVENPLRQGPIEFKSIPHEETGSRQLLKLTKNGHRFLTHTENAGKGPAVYHDFTKPREAHHDADLNRLYQKTTAKMEAQRGRNLRVVHDYELKKHLYRSCKARQGPQFHLWQTRHCRGYGLQVVRGKTPVPDVRIEYETGYGEWARVDLELATGHSRGRNLTEKVRPGFSLYAHADDVSKLRWILDQRELTPEILSL